MSVILRALILTSILLGLAAPTFSATLISKSSDNTFELDSLLKTKKLTLTRNDKRIANNISKLFDVSKRGYPNQQIVKNIIKKLKSNQEFSVFKVWAENILSISNLKKLSSAQSLCKKILNQKNLNSIESYLNNNNQELCINKLLSLLSKAKINGLEFSKQISLLKNHTDLLLTRNNEDDLAYFLVQLQKTKKHFYSLSDHLTKYYIRSKQIPSDKILQYMHINHDLTKFIQQSGYDKNSTSYILHNELSKLVREAFKAADNNEEKKIINSKVEKVINYFNSTYTYLPKEKSSNKLLGLGKSLTRRELYPIAQSLFNTLIELDSPILADAYFELLWTELTQENYSKAFSSIIKKHNLVSKLKKLNDSRLSFWIGYTLMQEGDSKFQEIFEYLIQDNPVSYYAIVASKNLQSIYKEPFHDVYLKVANKNKPKPLNKKIILSDNTYHSLKRLKLWGELDAKSLINIELSQLKNTLTEKIDKNNSHIDYARALDITYYLAAQTLKDADNYLESFKVVYSGISRNQLTVNQGVLDLLYPKPYWGKVNKYVKGFDPIIALSLIRQESAFNNKARSHVGARGLMQIMPNTGRQFWRRLKNSQLYNPNINIRIGAKYLSNLMKRYDDNLVYTLSAYNAGESRVKKWRKEYLTSDSILHNIENIPFSETRKYVKLIFRNIFFYKLEHNQEKLKTIELAQAKSNNHLFDIYLGFKQ